MPLVKSEYQAGLFISIAIAILVVGIWALGQERHIFTKQVEYFTLFSDVQGLAEGAPVRMGGIAIGRVAGLEFTPSVTSPRVQVALLINSEDMNRIRRDSSVIIQGQGLLGDKFLSVTPGKEPQLIPGSIIRGIESADIASILDRAGTVVENTTVISEQVRDVIERLNAGTIQQFSETVANMSDILKNIKHGNGLVHRVVYSDEYGTDVIGNIEKVSDDIQSITNEIRSGDGLLNTLIFDDNGKETMTAVSSAASSLAEAADDVTAIAEEIRTGNSLLHELVFSESSEGITDLLQRLNETAENLRVSSESLAQGSGTLGALLVDSQLYDNMVEVTDGAKRSIILRQAIKNSMEQ